MNNMIKATNAGTTMTQKGEALLLELLSSIPTEMNLPKCSIALGNFNLCGIVEATQPRNKIRC
jgi:hypothetical protein